MGKYKAITPKEYLYRAVYSKYKHKAKLKKREFTLSFEFFYHLTCSNCYLCGKKPSNKVTLKGKSVKYNGLDRINAATGYTPDNVAPCCRRCNESKMDQSLEGYFIRVAKIIKYSASLVPLRQQLIELESD